MRFNGDLDGIGLADLFQALSDMNATGTLVFSGEMGEKRIMLAGGEMALSYSGPGEKSRLGDILVARGKVSEEGLKEALALQKKEGGKIGEILLRKGAVKEKDIRDAILFQAEEEIYDLFTWRGAHFEFIGGTRGAEFDARTEGGRNVLSVSLDVRALLLDAARRADEWVELDRRLPSPFLAFKISDKGREFAKDAPAALRNVLDLIAEGRTLETIVKRSCLGRFNVYKGVIHLLDGGYIFPYPVRELRLLASEHRAHGRYADALNLYRRLRDAAEDDTERKEIARQIEDTVRAIEAARRRGDLDVEAKGISYQEAAREYKRRARLKRVAAILSVGTAAIAGLSTLSVYLERRRVQIAESYLEVSGACREHLDAGRYAEAIEIWDRYLKNVGDPDGTEAKMAIGQRRQAWAMYEKSVRDRIGEIRRMEETGRYLDALNAAERLAAREYRSPFATEIEGIAARLRGRVATETALERLAAAARKSEEGLGFERAKRYSEARSAYEAAARIAEAGSDPARSADEGLRRLADIEGRARAHLQIGLALEREGKSDQALAEFDAARAEWPDCQWARTAAERAAAISDRMARASAALESAGRLREAGRTEEALAEYRRVLVEFGDLRAAAAAHLAIEELSRSVRAFDELLADARAAWEGGDRDKASALYGKLLERFPNEVAGRRDLEIPVRIECAPQADVVADGKPVGRTPLWTLVPASRPFEVILCRNGFAERRVKIRRLGPGDLRISAVLDKAPIRSVRWPASLPAPPRLDGNRLLASVGISVCAYSPDNLEPIRSVEVSRYAPSHRRPDGSEEPVPREYWHLRAAPSTMPGGCIIGTPDGRVVLLAKDLEKAGEIELPCAIAGGVAYGHVKLTRRDFAFACGSNGVLYGLDIAGQKIAWTAQVGKSCSFGPAIAPGMVAVAADEGRVVGVAPHSGTVEWSFDTGAAPAAEPLAAEIGGSPKILLVLKNGVLLCLDFGDGKPIFRIEDPQFKAASVSVWSSAEEGFVAVSAEDGRLRRLAPDGRVAWTATLEGPSLPPAISPRGICAATKSGTVYWLSRDTGKVVWKYRAAGSLSACAVFGDRVFLSASDGSAVLLDSADQ